MSFNLDQLSYDGKSLNVTVFKDNLADFAFYILLASKKIDMKWYSRECFSSLDVVLSKNKVYSLILFFRPNSEKTKEEEKVVKKVFFKIKDNGCLVVINEELLYEADNFKISEYNQDSDTTFITFNSAYTDKSSDPFAGSFVLSEGWNLISVRKHNKNPYQDLSLQTFEDIVKPRISQKRVFTYGTSLGGYSSIYFGGVINATIIASAPRLSLITSSNIRYKNIDYKHVPIKNTIKTVNPVYIIYDPLVNWDVEFIKKHILSAYPSAKFLPVKRGTHLVVETLISKGLLKEVIRDLVDCNNFNAINRITIAMD